MPEPVGSVYSDYGYYYPDRFSVILREGVDVKPGEFLWIITSEGKVYYQAIGLYIKRQPASYEEVILKKGPRMMDEERNFPSNLDTIVNPCSYRSWSFCLCLDH